MNYLIITKFVKSKYGLPFQRDSNAILFKINFVRVYKLPGDNYILYINKFYVRVITFHLSDIVLFKNVITLIPRQNIFQSEFYVTTVWYNSFLYDDYVFKKKAI